MRLLPRLVLICSMLCAPIPAPAADESVEPADGGNADDAGSFNDVSADRRGPAQGSVPGDPGPPVLALDPRCSDMHACLKIRPVRGKICHAQDSLILEISNVCKRPVALGVCIEQADHVWDCEQAKLGAGQTNKKAFSTCHSTGTFRALASAASDHAKQPCFTAPQAGVGTLVPGAYLNVCTRVKMCCRALQSLPGADSLAQACDALDALPDNVGVEACAEILNVMRRETSTVAGTPQICR